MELQHRLTAVLAEKGISQSDLADRAGIDRADVSRLLKSSEPRFTVRTILKLSRALEMTPVQLLAGVDQIPEKLGDDLKFWIDQFSEAEAAIKERDDLRRSLEATLADIGEKFRAVESRHAEELERLRGANGKIEAERNRLAVELRKSQADNDGLRVEVDALRRQLDAAVQRETGMIADVAGLREQLATTKKEKVASGVLGALFGAGAGALLGRAAAVNNDETDFDDDQD